VFDQHAGRRHPGPLLNSCCPALFFVSRIDPGPKSLRHLALRDRRGSGMNLAFEFYSGRGL
jgi:hypothetical protein